MRAAAIRVLQRIAENMDPKGTVTEILFSDGSVGYRAHFVDSASNPEGGHSVLINAENILIGGDHDREATSPRGGRR